MNNEIWKDIPGYEGIYQVSNLGSIKRLPLGKQWPSRKTHNNLRVLRDRNGYLSVNLSRENSTKWWLVHRLVAIAFIPNPQGYPCVNHKDENKRNNRADNLEWCSYEYNANYGLGRERQKISRANNPLDYISRRLVGEMNSKAVKQLSKDGQLIATYASLTEASQATGINISTIIRQCKGYTKGVRKYKFQYM